MPDIALSEIFTDVFGVPPVEPDVMDEPPIACVVGLACLDVIYAARKYIHASAKELSGGDLAVLARQTERTCMVFNRG